MADEALSLAAVGMTAAFGFLKFVKPIPNWVAWSGVTAGLALLLGGLMPEGLTPEPAWLTLYCVGTAVFCGGGVWWWDRRHRLAIDEQAATEAAADDAVAPTRIIISNRIRSSQGGTFDYAGENVAFAHNQVEGYEDVKLAPKGGWMISNKFRRRQSRN